MAFSMAVHELCTNAIKYGALSNEAGSVEIKWDVVEERFSWSWRERGGPNVVAPLHKGFGTRMIERSLAIQLSAKVTLDHATSGLICTIEASLGAIQNDGT